MTKDEILAMKPGSALDELVAVEIMGYERSQMRDGWVRIGALGTYPKQYSTDISAAWEVVEKMNLIVSPNNNGGWKAGRFDGARLENYHVIWSERWVFAETAPEAICKAALLALEGEQK